MLDISEASNEGSRVKLLLEELLKAGRREDLVELTLQILSSMKVLVSGAPDQVKERVQLVLSQLTMVSREIAKSDVADSESLKRLEDIVKSIGAVSETLVQWYINKKLRHEEQPEPEAVPSDEVELVKKFRNFLTRRNPRVYLPTLHRPETALEMSLVVFERSSGELYQCQQYSVQIEHMVQLLRALASLLDIEDRLFVNRFPYRAQVFSFTEELVTKMRKMKSIEPFVDLLRSLAEAVVQLVTACRERLTGDVTLKRAESMIMRPGGALPHCLNNVVNTTQSCLVKVVPMDIKCIVECKSVTLVDKELTLKTLSSATTRYLVKKLSQQIGVSSHLLRIAVDGDDITDSSALRAGDLADKTLYITDSGPTNPLESQENKTFARAVYDFMVDTKHNLSFARGDIIEVTKKSLDGWWDGKLGQKSGIFPASFVEELSESQVLAALSPDKEVTEDHLTSVGKQFSPSKTQNTPKNPEPLPTSPRKTLLNMISSSAKRRQNFFTPENKLFKSGVPSYGNALYTADVETTGDRRRRQSDNDKHHKILGSLKEGLLKKEGSGGKFWNARYFVLHQDRLVYYKTTQARPPPAGIICFSEVVFAAATSHKPAHSHCFTLQGIAGKRSYYLIGKSQEDMNEWIQNINQALRINKLGSNSSSTASDLRGVRLAAAAACIDYLMCDNRYKQKNILRVPGNEREIKQCIKIIEGGQVPELELIPNANTVAGLFKALFRRPSKGISPLVPLGLSKVILDLIGEAREVEGDVRCSLLSLDSDCFAILRDMIHFFSLIINNGDGLCTIDLARSFGVLIFQGQDVSSAHSILDYLISNQAVVLT